MAAIDIDRGTAYEAGAGALKIEVSIDPEGNDGGHLFGVPPQTDLDLLLAAVAV